MGSEEYLRLKEQNEREIAHWEALTTDDEQAALELRLCMETLNRIVGLWETVSGEDRQGMARMLFEYIEYDLDAKRITDFRLKPWADKFLVLRAELYQEQTPNGDGENSEEDVDKSSLAERRVLCPRRESNPRPRA
jgi:hypothetical protein